MNPTPTRSSFRVRPSVDERDDDAQLEDAIIRAQAGDSEGIGLIYERYADNVFSYVRTMVDEHEAEDVTQQVFMKLLTRIDRYEPYSVPFVAWLLRIARNAAIDRIRSNRALPVEEPDVAEPSREETRLDDRDALAHALKALSEPQREVIVLRHFADLSPCQIALRMDRSEGAVHTLYHRARRALCGELALRDTVPVAAGRGHGPGQ